MKVKAFVVTEGHHVEFEIPDGSTTEQIKAMAITIADGEECTWMPTVDYIIVGKMEVTDA